MRATSLPGQHLDSLFCRRLLLVWHEYSTRAEGKCEPYA